MNSPSIKPEVAQAEYADLHELARFLTTGTPSDNLDKLVDLALSYSLAPMFLYQLRKHNLQLEDPAVLDNLKSSVQFSTMIFLQQEWAMREANKTLTEAGIRCVWFKGAALSAAIYPEPNLRTKSDIDCIVPEGEVSTALQVLLNMNYEFPKDESVFGPVIYDNLSRQIKLQHKQHSQVYLELHRHLLGLSGPKFIPPKHLNKWINNAINFDFDGQTALTFRHEYHLLYMFAHAFMQHGEEEIGLRQLFDMHQMIVTFDIDWKILIDEAIALKWTFLVEYALKRLQEYFDTPIELYVFETLSSQRSKDESINQIYLLREQFIDAESVFKNIRSLSAKKQFIAIFQIAFPSRAYMRKRYNIPKTFPVLPYYIYRSLNHFKDMFAHLFQHLFR